MKNIKNTTTYKFIDLFAGIGGFHIALSNNGASCVFSSEWDLKASNIYEQNFKITPAGDITKILEKEIPSHDIICGGFPCQAFSVSGNQKGFNDTRGTLFFDIARIAKYHKPKVLFLENVKNLIKHDNGNTLKTILNTLDEIGYNVNYKILNASHFGLPQNRERVYFVCFRKDLVNTFSFPKETFKPVSVKDILEPNANIDFIERDDINIYKDFKIEIDVFNNVILPNKPVQIGKVNKGGQGERIYHTLGHAITLSAYGGGVGSKTGLYFIDGKIRKLTPRECARVQGFPESFKIHPLKTEAYKQFGNSVAVNVIDAIYKNILNVLKQNESKTTERVSNC